MRCRHLITVALTLCLAAGTAFPLRAIAETHTPPAASAVVLVPESDRPATLERNPQRTDFPSHILFHLRESLDSLLGIAYRFGSLNPARGLDCSGLVVHVFSKLGMQNLPRTASGLASLGAHIDKDELRFGDLVFFNTRGRRYSHVGIYIGEGRFIHAATRGRKVMENSLAEGYYQVRYNGARRLIAPDL
jgi:hypothetical protein